MDQQTLTAFTSHLANIYGPWPSTLEETEKWIPRPLTDAHRGRYLWTDSFAILDFVTLAYLSKYDNDQQQPSPSPLYLSLATRLLTYTTSILSTTHSGPPYTPLPNGGLRIGKPTAHGPDQDGQYYHYLLVYLFTLNRLSLATSHTSHNTRALHLAKHIHKHFTAHTSFPDRPHITWKLDETLSYPLSGGREGNVDPIMAYSVFRLLQSTGAAAEKENVHLAPEIAVYESIVKRKVEHGWTSSDMLDIGMTLWSCHWFCGEEGEEWADMLCETAAECAETILNIKLKKPSLSSPSLAFRDYGACLGLKCYASTLVSSNPAKARKLQALAEEILESWERRGKEKGGRHRGHKGGVLDIDDDDEDEEEVWLKPITEVMHCAALVPGAFMKGFLS
ncbi:hypothetical protein DFH27DRAFT_652645 [Peziza echinospora]|nr:hypothetical protein DFH27DRAFT_652645 [Peziza echinospora]